jgi:hypothetical protein
MGAIQASAEGSTARSVAEAHARLRADPAIQFDLPSYQPPPPPKPSEWSRSLAELFAGIAPYATWIFWGLIALGAVLILALVARHYIRNRASRDAVADPAQEIAAWRPEEKVARALLAEADAMAAAGRFEEAARLLLHRSLEEIQRNRPRFLRPALTSREIGRADALPDVVRGAFLAMAAPVERSLFGGRSLSRADWEEARTAYGEFALPGAWR